MAHICPHCQIGFNVWQDYQEHLSSSHRHLALESRDRAVAVNHRNVSGRTKAQIVNEAELTWLAPFIISSSNEAEHLDACRCVKCFQRQLDRIIKSQEEWI